MKLSTPPMVVPVYVPPQAIGVAGVVGVGVGVDVSVAVWVGVAVGVSVGDGGGVSVAVGVAVGVPVEVGVGEGVNSNVHQGAVALRSKKADPHCWPLTVRRSAWVSEQQLTGSVTVRFVVVATVVKVINWVWV